MPRCFASVALLFTVLGIGVATMEGAAGLVEPALARALKESPRHAF